LFDHIVKSLLCLATVGVIGGVNFAHAGTPTQGCVSDVRDVMTARASMGFARDVEMAEKLISISRSVMEYSCFSGDDYASDVVTAYRNDNFGTTSCNHMGVVFQASRCNNFSLSDFQTFTELEATDPRGCSSGSRDSAWSSALTASTPAAATPAASGGMDALVTYLQQMIMNDTGTSDPSGGRCEDQEPIPTGVMADRDGELSDPPYEDKVCMSAGCYFDPVNLTSTTDDVCREVEP
tara:strand:+ start:784 stop:1494 length:711 start_codon:yes stop_codon:yes gene_type:complete